MGVLTNLLVIISQYRHILSQSLSYMSIYLNDTGIKKDPTVKVLKKNQMALEIFI